MPSMAANTLGTAPPPPVFRAVTSSTRPLYQLLRAIGFTNKVHVEITDEGIRFMAEHARVMQGMLHTKVNNGKKKNTLTGQEQAWHL